MSSAAYSQAGHGEAGIRLVIQGKIFNLKNKLLGANVQ